MSKVWVVLRSVENGGHSETKVAGVFSVYEDAYTTAIKEILHWCEEEAGIEGKDIYSSLKVEECELVKVVSYGNRIPLNVEEFLLAAALENLSELAESLYQQKHSGGGNSKGKGVETKPEEKLVGKLVRFTVTSHLVDVYEADDEDYQLQATPEAPDEHELSGGEGDEDDMEDIDSDLEMDVDEDELNGLLEDLEHGPEELLAMASTYRSAESASTAQPRPGSSKS
ncbi:hypothetical protein K493DRAFT_314361 [Basidiobolus meristosporus CBS 931.73]|uniref:Uncharacterized protein n=1 Tax=Basidiobolus meristosporus CBS 931.73 TaxID=1314790 RepID=A0A1Y1YFH1_9FUNG|nr:hypothetical protein K493DRAFT_314361 [Basidiobolus meristosporus CBS 931.73]|eukprot:ORX96725.1 hypothetical protein K493DRAFT_314361 [Basidiobolus meristosporus CBS 931.73]